MKNESGKDVIPQANNWAIVEDLLKFVYVAPIEKAVNQKVVAERFGFSLRQADYYAHALSFFGFLHKKDSKHIWPLGLSELGCQAAQGKIGEESFCEWVLSYLNDWSACGAVIQNKEEEAILDLMSLDNLNETTARRRISTIKAWYKSLTQRYKEQMEGSGASFEMVEQMLAKQKESLLQQQKEKRQKIEEQIVVGLNAIPKAVLLGDVVSSQFEKSVVTKVRRCYGQFTKGVESFWNNTCGLTGVVCAPVLRNSHIKSWADSEGREKVDPDNGLLLEARYDSLFDKHLISFDDGGGLLISKKLSAHDKAALGLDENQKLSKPLTEKMKSFMSYHRTKFFAHQGGSLVPTV